MGFSACGYAMNRINSLEAVLGRSRNRPNASILVRQRANVPTGAAAMMRAQRCGANASLSSTPSSSADSTKVKWMMVYHSSLSLLMVSASMNLPSK